MGPNKNLAWKVLRREVNRLLRRSKPIPPNFQNPIEIYQDDTFLVSYPKSGSTWVAFLLGNYLTDNQIDFINRKSLIPDLHADTEICRRLKRPRIIKCHFQFNPGYRNVIYICRDGRDVAVSYYYFLLKLKAIDTATKFTDFLDQFNSGKIKFGLWRLHINSWLNNQPSRFMVIRYEDLLNDPAEQLERILDFQEIRIDSKRLESAVAASQFEAMKALESEQYSQVPQLAETDPSIRFVRKGEKNQYLSHFSKADNRKFLNIHRTAMKKLGYI